MANSQLKIYKSLDAGAPQCYGITGSLLDILNKCLVTGYGSTTPAGWLKPLPDTGSYGIFTQPSGSLVSFFINDAGGATTYTSRYANVSGWETISSIEGGNVTGSGQFPTAAQQVTSPVPGSLGIAKNSLSSSIANPSSSVSPWIIFADHMTCYIFILNSVVANIYGGTMFGDIYSYSTASDSYKAMVIGNHGPIVNNTQENFGRPGYVTSATTGHFLARSYTGAAGGSIVASKHGDIGKSGIASDLSGKLAYPNGVDNGIYICPFYVCEVINTNIRGVLRGCWHTPHPATSFTDGQIITGTTGDFNGKTFMAVKLIGTNDGVCLMETSNTVITN